ncbi:MAG: septum formation initiator family protein [Rhodothermales bacterium]
MPASSSSSRHRLQRPLLAAALLLVVLWFSFFDSHSLVKRVRWHQEYARLAEENEALRKEIKNLEALLKQPLSDEVIEQIAREQYGMRRAGETVYRTEQVP